MKEMNEENEWMNEWMNACMPGIEENFKILISLFWWIIGFI
jgi:hypothetical protein